MCPGWCAAARQFARKGCSHPFARYFPPRSFPPSPARKLAGFFVAACVCCRSWRNQSDSDRGAANARIVAAQVAILFALSTSFPSATFAQTGTTQDSLLRAVCFAVTGSDANHVQISNQEKCVFTVKDITVHFSNIDPSRVGFTPWRYLTGVVLRLKFTGRTQWSNNIRPRRALIMSFKSRRLRSSVSREVRGALQDELPPWRCTRFAISSLLPST